MSGPSKIPVDTSELSPASDDFKSSSEDLRSSSDEFQPSSDDLKASSSSDDLSDDIKSSSSSDDTRRSSSADGSRSSFSSDDDAIPQPKSRTRDTSHRALQPTNVSKPVPQKILRKTTAVGVHDTKPSPSSSDDDAIPLTSRQKKSAPKKLPVRDTKPAPYKTRRKTSAVDIRDTVPSPSDSDDEPLQLRLQRRKRRQLQQQPIPTAALVTPKPPVSMKRSLPLPTSTGASLPFRPPKQLKVVPPPNPNALSTNQMNAIFGFVIKPMPMPKSVATASVAPPPLPPPTAISSLQKLVSMTIPQPIANSSAADGATAAQPSTSSALHHVSPMCAKILKEISPSDFTDQFLQSGIFRAKILTSGDSAFGLISEYITNSQAHATFKVNLQAVLEINRLSTSTPTTSGNPDPPKFTMMLWHGTKPQNVAAILENGFRCPATGAQMFGQGVYFADRISKSSQYCSRYTNFMTPRSGDVGYLFLCEVVIGKCYNARVSNPNYKAVPTATGRDGRVKTFDSVMCTGGSVPDRAAQREIDGVTWPLGRTVANTKFQTYTVQYNEYIVYDPERIKIKFLVKVVFG